MRLLPSGSAALLVELDDLDAVLALHAALAASPDRPAGVLDLIPAARTVLIRLDPAAARIDDVARWVRSTRPAPGGHPAGGHVEIPVRYDGADLAAVGELTGLGARGVANAHTGQTWTVAFTGFAPGFGYLVGEDDRLHVPRRDEPRTRVPAGSVGLAGQFSGVYPRESPGGWQLIGRTDLAVWDLGGDPPALLRPGVRVRFTAVRS